MVLQSHGTKRAQWRQRRGDVKLSWGAKGGGGCGTSCQVNGAGLAYKQEAAAQYIYTKRRWAIKVKQFWESCPRVNVLGQSRVCLGIRSSEEDEDGLAGSWLANLKMSLIAWRRLNTFSSQGTAQLGELLMQVIKGCVVGGGTRTWKSKRKSFVVALSCV